jgi:ribosomal protein S18 acetylase RimI-like enzyme
MQIRPAGDGDRDAIWRILEPVIRAGETYALPRDMSRADALDFWLAPGNAVFVGLLDGEVAGTYYLRANQKGGGAHVANCGYMVDPRFAGRGLARRMGMHSIGEARERGFSAMQFNFVVSSNEHAVRLWKSLGFTVAGTLPRAFAHPRLGLVDVFVMFREL